MADVLVAGDTGPAITGTIHSAGEKGAAEITGVHGWVVMRENGKVYTKASVAVR